MEKDIIDGKIGTVGTYDVEFKGGKLRAVVLANTAVGSAGITLEIGAEQVITAIEKAIPGQIDDAILEMLKKLII